MKLKRIGVASLAVGFCAAACAGLRAAKAPTGLPPQELNLVLSAPIKTWDEAVPLGNGLVGGLLWGETNLVRLSLDRGDLWDERPAPGDPLSTFTYAQMAKLVAKKKNDEIARIADRQGYDQIHPTKIPAGRLEIVLDPAQQVKTFELNLATAEGRAWFTNGAKLEAFFSSERFPRQRRPDQERLQQLHLPPLHPGGQLPGRRRRPRNAPAKLERPARQRGLGRDPPFPRHALALARGVL